MLRRLKLWAFNKSRELWVNTQRESIYNSLKFCGRNCFLQLPLSISQPQNVEIGHDVAVAAYVHIWGGGSVKIGSRVMIASHVAITSLSHDHEKEIMNKTLLKAEVVIADDVWIGSHAVILPGVSIGRGAVIGAGSIVTKDVAPLSIVFGCPAKLHKYRNVSNSSK